MSGDAELTVEEQLRKELKLEQNRCAQLERVVAEMQRGVDRSPTSSTSSSSAIRTNDLMVRLRQVQNEEEHMEEAMRDPRLSGDETQDAAHLKLRLFELKQEKIVLECRLGHEQEAMVNKLHKRILRVEKEKAQLEVKLESSSVELLNQLHEAISTLESNANDARPEFIGKLAEEIERLHATQKRFEKERTEYMARNDELQNQLRRLEDENFVLTCKVEHEQQRTRHLVSQKASIQAEFEMQSERQFHSDSSLTKPKNSEHPKLSHLLTISTDYAHPPSLTSARSLPISPIGFKIDLPECTDRQSIASPWDTERADALWPLGSSRAD